MDIGNVVLEKAFDTERFREALSSSDDIGAVIRSHFEVEQALEYALSKITNGRTNRKVKSWTFAQKVEVLHVLGVHENWVAPLKVINNQRNDFAHKGLAAFDNQHILDFFRATKQLTPILENPEFKVLFTGSTNTQIEYGKATLKEKYVMIAMVLASFLLALPNIKWTPEDREGS